MLLNQENIKPNVLHYTSPSQFLSDYYKYRQQLDKSFSYETWSFELGLNNRSYIYKLCLNKKAIGLDTALLLSKNLSFNEKQTEHFVLISLHNKSKSFQEQKIYQDKYLETLSVKRSKAVITDVDTFLSDIHLPLLMLVLSFKDFKGSLENIKRITTLDPEIINKKLQILLKLNLVDFKENIWVTKFEGFKASTDQSMMAKNIFHSETLKDAIGNISKHPSLSKYSHTTISMREEHFKEMTNDIKIFFNKIKNKYGTDELVDSRIFKINLQTYPVTEKYSQK